VGGNGTQEELRAAIRLVSMRRCHRRTVTEPKAPSKTGWEQLVDAPRAQRGDARDWSAVVLPHRQAPASTPFGETPRRPVTHADDLRNGFPAAHELGFVEGLRRVEHQ